VDHLGEGVTLERPGGARRVLAGIVIAAALAAGVGFVATSEARANQGRDSGQSGTSDVQEDRDGHDCPNRRGAQETAV
jgi:hypothetical protein